MIIRQNGRNPIYISKTIDRKVQIMRIRIHIIKGYNEDSIKLARTLQHNHESVYIVTDNLKDILQKHNEFVLVNPAFVDALNTEMFQLFTYEPPYKGPSFFMNAK